MVDTKQKDTWVLPLWIRLSVAAKFWTQSKRGSPTLKQWPNDCRLLKRVAIVIQQEDNKQETWYSHEPITCSSAYCSGWVTPGQQPCHHSSLVTTLVSRWSTWTTCSSFIGWVMSGPQPCPHSLTSRYFSDSLLRPDWSKWSLYSSLTTGSPCSWFTKTAPEYLSFGIWNWDQQLQILQLHLS